MTAPKPLPAPSAADRAAMPRPADQFLWNDQQKLVAHRNMHHLCPAAVVPAAAHVHPLPRRDDSGLIASLARRGVDVATYMDAAEATALLVIRNGEIALERYARGNDESTLWASRSMAKSVTSLMIGTAVLSGQIGSVDDPVTAYLPELAGSHYDGVALRHLLQMTSGVAYSEDYTDRSSDVARLQLCTVGGRKGAFLDFVKDLGRRPGKVPGTVFNYCSADTVLLGLVLERALGYTAPVQLERTVWGRAGMEADAYWNLEAEDGSAFTASGIGATLRDYGRIGLIALADGILPDGTRLVREDWMAQSTVPSQASIDAGSPYGFQWWIHEHAGIVSTKMGAGESRLRGGSGVFYAVGNAGQLILVNPAENTVVVKWAIWGAPATFETRRSQDRAFLAALFESLNDAG